MRGMRWAEIIDKPQGVLLQRSRAGVDLGFGLGKVSLPIRDRIWYIICSIFSASWLSRAMSYIPRGGHYGVKELKVWQILQTAYWLHYADPRSRRPFDLHRS